MHTQRKKHFYVTTTLPYVNSDPHLGFALEIVQADVIARWHRKKGEAVFFNTGTDEHGIKIYRRAREQGLDPQAYVDEYAKRFAALKDVLNLSFDNFIRTTDRHHVRAAQEFWRRCDANGDIYKKNYQVKYCVGCELEKTDSELENGYCPYHPGRALEHIDEENYFFRFSAYGDRLLAWYDEHPDFVAPATRMKEIRAFVSRGLRDFSISRRKEKMPWGVPVPDDDEHVMYVWFDALVNYISAIGWPDDEERFASWWPAVQVAGKDNLRQQSAMWQAMLLSAGLPPSRQIVIHGFITSGGRKMSKTLGNVADPVSIAREYGADALRYYLLREIHPFEDGDFTMERFREVYNAHLANGLSNLVARTVKMAARYFKGGFLGVEYLNAHFTDNETFDDFLERRRCVYAAALDAYRFNEAADTVWEIVGALDGFIARREPYKLVKHDPEEARRVLNTVVRGIGAVADLLEPFMPDTSSRIQAHVHIRQDGVHCTDLDTYLFTRRATGS